MEKVSKILFPEVKLYIRKAQSALLCMNIIQYIILSFLSCLNREFMILSLNAKKTEDSQVTLKTSSIRKKWKSIWKSVAGMLGRLSARLCPIWYKEILFYINQILPSILVSIKSLGNMPSIIQDTCAWFFGQVCLKNRHVELFEKLKSF